MLVKRVLIGCVAFFIAMIGIQISNGVSLILFTIAGMMWVSVFEEWS